MEEANRLERIYQNVITQDVFILNDYDTLTNSYLMVKLSIHLLANYHYSPTEEVLANLKETKVILKFFKGFILAKIKEELEHYNFLKPLIHQYTLGFMSMKKFRNKHAPSILKNLTIFKTRNWTGRTK